MDIRRRFEPRFGRDFGGVRIHDDAEAAASARAVGARAYTVGSQIVFGSGAYAAHTASGRWLLAHELTHVTQSGSGEVLRRAPCKSGAPCQKIAGDPAAMREDTAKQSQQNQAAQANAPAGSAAAAKKARLGEHAVHMESLLTGHGIPLRKDVAGFFVEPSQPANVLGTTKCKFFPGGSPGTPPVSGEQYCVRVPAEIEDEAKTLDTNAQLTDKQRLNLASLLAIGSHEMQHAVFDEAKNDIEFLSRGSSKAGKPECMLDTAVDSNATVGDMLSEISAITAEFPVYFQNIAQVNDPAAAMESHEKFNALTSSENISGAIRRLQCTCPCQMVDDFVLTAVMFTAANWPAPQRIAFFRIMTRLLGDLWPITMRVSEAKKP